MMPRVFKDMEYDIPFFAPCLAPHYCLASFLCPCFVSSLVYSRLFTDTYFSLFAFVAVPFGAYGIRRYVITKMGYPEHHEVSVLKSLCFCISMTQDVNEMKTRQIGVFLYDDEPQLEESVFEL